jgi:predicted DNA-binding transcriptional regulator AlpA
MSVKPKKIGPRQGTVVVWPSGVQERYGISAPTRWRWEKLGLLPKRDVAIGGKTGWRPETLAQAEIAKAAAT